MGLRFSHIAIAAIQAAEAAVLAAEPELVPVDALVRSVVKKVKAKRKAKKLRKAAAAK
jgi:hypothetical protein